MAQLGHSRDRGSELAVLACRVRPHRDPTACDQRTRNVAFSGTVARRLFAAIQGVAPSLGVEVSPSDVRDVGEIERAVAVLRALSNGGLIVTASGLATVHRDLIITLAARHKLPAVYYERFFAGRLRGRLTYALLAQQLVMPGRSVPPLAARNLGVGGSLAGGPHPRRPPATSWTN